MDLKKLHFEEECSLKKIIFQYGMVIIFLFSPCVLKFESLCFPDSLQSRNTLQTPRVYLDQDTIDNRFDSLFLLLSYTCTCMWVLLCIIIFYAVFSVSQGQFYVD